MSETGYYRFRCIASVDRTVKFYVNGTLEGTKQIKVETHCNPKILKFLDRNGQYKFLAFNRFWEQKAKIKQIGSTSRLIENILSGQSNTRNVGYDSENSLNLIADEVPQDDLHLYYDLSVSPCVYLYIGDGSNYEPKDWLMVTISNKDSKIRIKKGDYSKIEIDVILPETFTIKMI